jgi:beta-N-acetylhexosaminidase
MLHRALGMLFLLLAATTLPVRSAAVQKPAQRPVQKQAQRPARKADVPQSRERHDQQTAQAWLKRMTLREQVAQLLIIHFYGNAPGSRSKEWRDFLHLVRDTRVGGLILLNRTANGVVQNAEPYETAAFLNRMQRIARTPLIVGGDFERGASMRIAGTTKFPHLMAYGAAGDVNASRVEGQATAREARAMGFHWIFAPVADVNNNPENPIINIRSYGENPEAVAAHVKAYIEGAHSGSAPHVLVTAKHFPGHGDTATDSHIGLARLDADRSRLDAVELVPFRAAIAAGVDAVMTAHMAVPALEPREIPATVSAAVLTGLLRQDLGFRGLIVTDAMDMQGLSKQFSPGEAAVRALEAGADILLIPPKPDEAVNAVVAAIQKGRLSRKRVEESVLRILTAKAQAGLFKKRLVDLEAIGDEIDSPEAAEAAQQVADHAVTLVRNTRSLLPLAQPERACYYVLFESRYSNAGRKLVEELRSRVRPTQIFSMEPNLPEAAVEQIAQAASQCSAAVVATFVAAAAYRGGIGLAGVYPKLMATLLGGATPVALLSLGNPYLLRNYQDVAAYMTTFSTSPSSERSAVKALFGEIPISGKMPISIPGLAAIGDGIEVPKTR